MLCAAVLRNCRGVSYQLRVGGGAAWSTHALPIRLALCLLYFGHDCACGSRLCWATARSSVRSVGDGWKRSQCPQIQIQIQIHHSSRHAVVPTVSAANGPANEAAAGLQVTSSCQLPGSL
jgi:hypothetical protein